MLVKELFNKLYPKLICFILIIFLLIVRHPQAEVLGEGGYRHSVEVNEIEDGDSVDDDSTYIEYKDIKKPKIKSKKRDPFSLFKKKKG